MHTFSEPGTWAIFHRPPSSLVHSTWAVSMPEKCLKILFQQPVMIQILFLLTSSTLKNLWLLWLHSGEPTCNVSLGISEELGRGGVEQPRVVPPLHLYLVVAVVEFEYLENQLVKWGYLIRSGNLIVLGQS